MFKLPPTIYSITLRPLMCLLYLLGIKPYNWARLTSQRHKCADAGRRLQCGHSCGILTLIAIISYYRSKHTAVLIYHVGDIFSSTIDDLGFATLVTLHLVIQLESTWKMHYYQRIFRKFEQLRALLRSEFGVRFNCALLQFYVCLLHAQLVLYCTVLAVYLALMQLSPLPTARFLLTIFSEVVLKIKMFEFASFVVAVTVMHFELCVAAERFLRQLDASRYDVWPLRRRCLARFFNLQELHTLLWEIVRDIAAYFEWSLPGMLLKQFLDLTLLGYWAYLSFENDAQSLAKQYCVVMWALQSLVLSVTCIICTVCEKSFYFGVTMYIVILIQFRMSV